MCLCACACACACASVHVSVPVRVPVSVVRTNYTDLMNKVDAVDWQAAIGKVQLDSAQV